MKLKNNSLGLNFQSFIDNCHKFYNNTLYEQSGYDTFTKGLEEVDARIAGLDKTEQMEELAKYFLTYIYSKDEPTTFKTSYQVETSRIIATIYLYNKEIFKQAFEGGKVNFSDYVQCFVESCTTKDNTVKLLMDDQMHSTIRSMAEMRYYRHNPPDREMY